MLQFEYIVLALLIFEIGAYTYSTVTKRQDIADFFWGITFILIVAVSLFVSGIARWPSLLVSFLVFVWGARLAGHIGSRRKKQEDPRYLELSKDWGRWFYLRSFLQTFLLQGLLALLISIPIVNSNFSKSYEFLPLIFFTGVGLWLVGFIIESVSDYQLRIFLKAGKGGVLKTGLWRFSRHPNYFGEVVLWWGLFVATLGIVPNSYWTIVGPVTITILILFVSGVPMLEKAFSENPEYQQYKKETSIFVPWFNKKGGPR